jgi:hypothetical protein
VTLSQKEWNERRQQLLDSMTISVQESGGKIVTKTVYFPNNDVPEFLERLQAFERRSRRSTLQIGPCYDRNGKYLH